VSGVQTDWSLVERAQAGDREAFAELYRAYRDVVYAFVQYRTGQRQLAEDIAQTVWVRAMRRIHTVEHQGRDIGAWLITIARNLITDHYKSGQYRREVSTGDVLDVEIAADNVEAEVEAAQDARAVRRGLDRLLPSHRRVLAARFLEDRPLVDVAAEFEINIPAVKALQYRATRALAADRTLRAEVDR
jgi:RNA polymerase sigma-70 factor (ECF subfamily)